MMGRDWLAWLRDAVRVLAADGGDTKRSLADLRERLDRLEGKAADKTTNS